MKYQVIVGNIGTVLNTDDRVQANSTFDQYKVQSDTGVGRAGGESVTMMEDGEPIKHHTGSLDADNE